MKAIAGFILALTLAWPATAAAQADLAAGLAHRYNGVAAISANYSRVSRTPKTDRLFQGSTAQMATGQLWWQSRAKLRLDQKAPQPEMMMTDGVTVWWHIPAEGLAYRYADVDVAGQLAPLLGFLDGLSSLEAEFALSAAQPSLDRPNQQGLVLSPKDKGRAPTVITVWCDGAFNLTGFQLKSPTGETVDFFLTGLAENPAVDGGLFKFTPPKGCQVIDEE